MNIPQVSVITPTTGKDSLLNLFESLEIQTVPYVHILLWDDKRSDKYLYPDSETLKVKSPHNVIALHDNSVRYSIVIPGSMVQGQACGSALRAIGLMAVNTPFVTFADDDVWYDSNHLENLLATVKDKQWAYCRRKVWVDAKECLGVDNFESVGDDKSRKVPYEMVDNNCMIFSRRFGSSAAVIYRETVEYNDDRLMYSFLKNHAGEPGRTTLPTVNQICPKRLEAMFRENCSRRSNVSNDKCRE